MGERVAASFRDPSGAVFSRGGKILRQVNQCYQADYDLLMSSGLYEKLTRKKLLIPHQEVDEAPLELSLVYKILQPETIDFISYPYEWAFSQLKDAALLTLMIQKEALQAGLSLKDASAYNIQFHRDAPVLIDTLSFSQYYEGKPWVAYRQFCQHFLAPLALCSKTDVRLNKLLLNFIDGVPLDLCSRLLPRSTWFNSGLLMHIHMHAKAENRYSSTSGEGSQNLRIGRSVVSKSGLIGLIDSLQATIEGLSLPIRGKEWANYYTDTNYTDRAFQAKQDIVRALLEELCPKRVLDLGANIGVFSRLAANLPGCLVISADIDPEAVELNYRQGKKDHQNNVLPLIVDLTNPTPAIGWNNQERGSFYSRAKSDVVLALALVHHLAIANNVPLGDIARTFAALGNYLVIEFVPKEDSQVKRLLHSRDDIFEQYNLAGLITAFAPYFELVRQTPVPESQRTILLFQAKECV